MGTMRLPIPLTDDEKLGILEEVAKAENDVEAEEAKKKAATAGHTTRIKGLKARIKELVASATTGSVEREVDVEERPNYKDGLVETWRLDTNVVVSTRTMDPAQRQMGLDLTNGTVGTSKAEQPTEEQQAADTPEHAEELRTERLGQEQRERIADEVDQLVKGATARDGIVEVSYRGLMFSFSSEDELRQALADFIEEDEQRTSERRGDADATARINEIAELAAEQAKDDAKTKKATLQVPKKGPKPKTSKKSKGNGKVVLPGSSEPVDLDEAVAKAEAENPDETPPKAEGDEDGLGF